MKTQGIKYMALLLAGLALGCNSKTNQTTDADSVDATTTEADNTVTAGVIPGTYTDLTTGKEVYIIADPQTGYAIDSISRVPVEFYINTTGDTLFRTGVVVNNMLVRSGEKWIFDDSKVKVDGDQIKIKGPDGKVKVESDGDIKVKDKDGKVKIEEDTVKVKPNN